MECEDTRFSIKDCALIAIATGKRAQNLRELKEYLTSISPESIYYHFWGSLLRPRFDDPEYHNDFAVWVAHSLHDKILAERLASLMPVDYSDMEDLRHEIIEMIEERLDETEVPLWSSRDKQFEFIRSQIVIFNTHHVVHKPEQFTGLLPHLAVGSIFFHFIDARRRNENSLDDFQNWLMNFGEKYFALRERLRMIDPYFMSLTELREEITTAFESCFQGDCK